MNLTRVTYQIYEGCVLGWLGGGRPRKTCRSDQPCLRDAKSKGAKTGQPVSMTKVITNADEAREVSRE